MQLKSWRSDGSSWVKGWEKNWCWRVKSWKYGGRCGKKKRARTWGEEKTKGEKRQHTFRTTHLKKLCIFTIWQHMQLILKCWDVFCAVGRTVSWAHLSYIPTMKLPSENWEMAQWWLRWLFLIPSSVKIKNGFKPKPNFRGDANPLLC